MTGHQGHTALTGRGDNKLHQLVKQRHVGEIVVQTCSCRHLLTAQYAAVMTTWVPDRATTMRHHYVPRPGLGDPRANHSASSLTGKLVNTDM